jgi:predicted O-methyltransferase YrrM
VNSRSALQSPLSIDRVAAALRWRAGALRARLRQVQSDGIVDYARCLWELGFALPALDTMQNYRRLKFLYDCIVRFAPTGGVALEIGCFKGTSTVFIAKACGHAGIDQVCAIDLFTGTPSWGTSEDYFDVTQAKLAAYGVADRVRLIRHHSSSCPWSDRISVLHIDADHAYAAVWSDIDKYTPFLVDNGIVVFDDYDISHPGVTRAVHRLLAESSQFEVVATNYQGVEFGSVCIRRVGT